ncbi:MAG: hypothetical protein IPG07_02425 [Crocinitomicaceae bacterium]|nr:hypothetical protein [Crocinitomicaceae bacterium]
MKRIVLVSGIAALVLLTSCKSMSVFALNSIMVLTQLAGGERQFEYRKEKDAAAECDKLDGQTQTYLTESYGLNCELK